MTLGDKYREVARALLDLADEIDDPGAPPEQYVAQQGNAELRQLAGGGLQPLRTVDELAPREYAPRPQVYTPPPPQAPGPSPVLDVNIATHCPKHGAEYRRGNYGPYCPKLTDDPAFADRKGYCNLPGENAQRALAWIAVQKGANNVR